MKKTQEQLAIQAGCTKGAVSQWEKGDVRNLRLARLVAVADALGVSVRWLAVGDGPEDREGIALKPDELSLVSDYRALSPGHRIAVQNFMKLTPEQRDMFSEHVLVEAFAHGISDAEVMKRLLGGKLPPST